MSGLWISFNPETVFFFEKNGTQMIYSIDTVHYILQSSYCPFVVACYEIG